MMHGKQNRTAQWVEGETKAPLQNLEMTELSNLSLDKDVELVEDLSKYTAMSKTMLNGSGLCAPNMSKSYK